jgi:hypothetical protein
MWDCLNQDDDDLLGLLGDQTPLRDCRDLFADIGGTELFSSDIYWLFSALAKPCATSVDITCKETLDPEESRESKRRRILDYPSESSQSEIATQETASTLVTPEVLQQPSHVIHCFFLLLFSH